MFGPPCAVGVPLQHTYWVPLFDRWMLLIWETEEILILSCTIFITYSRAIKHEITNSFEYQAASNHSVELVGALLRGTGRELQSAGHMCVVRERGLNR